MHSQKSVHVAILVFMLMLVPSLAFIGNPGVEKNEAEKAEDGSRILIPGEHYLTVPYHPQEANQQTAQAALQCVFDYFGPNIDQDEIDQVADPLIGLPVAEDIARAGHFSNMSTIQTSGLSGYTERGLGYSAFWFNWEGLPPNPSPYYRDRARYLKQMIYNGTPVILWTNINASVYTGNVWRVLTGYNDGKKEFYLHDLTGNDPESMFGGPGVAIPYGVFHNRIWNTSGGDHIGVVVQPWDIDMDIPVKIIAGTEFDISVKVRYPLEPPLDASQYEVRSSKLVLNLPSDFTILNQTAEQDLDIEKGGEQRLIKYRIIAPDKGNDRMVDISCMAYGTVSARNGVMRYNDLIGGTAQGNVTITGNVNYAPVIENANATPSAIPKDGETPTLITAKVTDKDGNLASVKIDLQAIGYGTKENMYDDGTNGDAVAGDDIFSVEKTASASVVVGKKLLEITATDALGRFASDFVDLEITTAQAPPPPTGKPPVLTDFLSDPTGAPNDGSTIVLFTVFADDPDNDLSSVVIDLSQLGGDSETPMYDDGSFGDLSEGDGIYSYETFIDSSVSTGTKLITATATDKRDNTAIAMLNFSVTVNNLKPSLDAPSALPSNVPNDGETEVLLTVRATDPNGNLKSVTISLSPISGVASQKMFDDGSNGDQSAGDNVYSFETTVPSTVTVGQKDLKITAVDQEGLTDTQHIFLQVTDANSPPEMTNAQVSDPSIENDNSTTVTFTVEVIDPDDNLDSVRIDLSPIGGSKSMKMWDDGENGGDDFADDNIFTAESVVSKNTPAGMKNLTIKAEDDRGAEVSLVISIVVKQREEDEGGGTVGGIDEDTFYNYVLPGIVIGVVVLVVLIVLVNVLKKPKKKAPAPAKPQFKVQSTHTPSQNKPAPIAVPVGGQARPAQAQVQVVQAGK